MMTFKCADGAVQTARKCEVHDLDDYLDGVANGTHGRIVKQMTSSIRNELGFYARYVSTAVDGVLQPD